MYIWLLLMLVLISLACFSESKVLRKRLKLLLSFGLAITFSILMETVTYMFVERHLLEGLIVGVLYFFIPLITFLPAQLLLFDIRLFQKD